MTTRIEITESTLHEHGHQRVFTQLVLPEDSGTHQTLVGEIRLDFTGMQTLKNPRQLAITGEIFGEEPVVFDMFDDIYGPTQGVKELTPTRFARVLVGE